MDTWIPASSLDRKRPTWPHPGHRGGSLPRQWRWLHQIQTWQRKTSLKEASEWNFLVKQIPHMLYYNLFNTFFVGVKHTKLSHSYSISRSGCGLEWLTLCWQECRDYRRPGWHYEQTRNRPRWHRGLEGETLNTRPSSEKETSGLLSPSTVTSGRPWTFAKCSVFRFSSEKVDP